MYTQTHGTHTHMDLTCIGMGRPACIMGMGRRACMSPASLIGASIP